MADLMFPNIGGNALSAFYQGQDRGRQSKLAQLLGTAVGDPAQRNDSINQAAMIDPRAAMSTRKALNDESLAELSRDAGMFVGLAQSGDEAAIQQAYTQLAQKGEQVFGHPLPQHYDPKYLPMFQQLAGAGGGTNGNVQSTYIDAQGNRVAIMRDGSTQVLGQNAPNNQIIDTGNGFYGVNKGNLNAAPVTIGGQQQGQPQQPQGTTFTASDGRPVSIDPSLPPEVQASIRAQEGQWANAPDGSTANIGGQQGQPAQQLPARPDYQNGGVQGQQLRSVPKPEKASALQDKIATARSLGASEDEIKAMVMGGSSGVAAAPGDPTKSGDAYLQTLEPAMRGVVKAIAEGRQAPPSSSSRSPQAQAILQAVYTYDPTANASNLPARTATRKDFTSGQSYKKMTALNQVAAHLELLNSQVDKVAGHSIPGIGNTVNSAINAYDRNSGKSGIIDWESTADAVAHETRSLFAGSGEGALQELEGYLRTLSANNSKDRSVQPSATSQTL